MRKRKTIELYHYWQAIRGTDEAPYRRALDPGAIRNLLPDLFILEDEGNDGACFRLAGTRICADFGQELRATAFSKLWVSEQRHMIRALFSDVMQREAPVVLDVTASTRSGQMVAMEMVVLPLRSNGETSDRIVGALATDRPANWHGSDLLVELTCTATSQPGKAYVASGRRNTAIDLDAKSVGSFLPHRPQTTSRS
ncbi:PAS domain-containing protein [Rhizobiaceae bacterium n13]|uniref:PAS domain-containing protein n=1 Tax=Ferirhizobium litorale TaxID=2927786 RepID=A0AAE3QEN4_9HYPH|nr:PAS domain-containing protein [Fererhizobium litorale]MDI7864045.1 PAS domain-containing protein [Fererhizobium litorale]MDI7924472.1 PAS domain-containing protein [Fererhizobium litorale]